MEYNKRDDTFALIWSKKIRMINSLGGKCSKCGKDNIFVLEMHHPDDNKEFSFTFARTYRWSIINSEISKCKLFCSNCHYEHHSVSGTRSSKMKEYVLKIKGQQNCQKCKYSGCALSFHHTGEKKFGIAEVISRKRKFDLKEIIEELSRCVEIVILKSMPMLKGSTG